MASFVIELKQHFHDLFQRFFQMIADTYQVDIATVRRTCFPMKSEKPLSKQTQALYSQAQEYILNEIPSMQMTLDKLKKLCSDKGLKVSGKKEILLNRIQNPTNPEHKGSGKRAKKSLFKPANVSKIIEKLRGPVSGLAIRKNAEGHYVHLETNLVFHPLTKRVCGKWHNNQVEWLTKQDVQTCIHLKVPYDLPENLDIGIVKVIDPTVSAALGEDDFQDDFQDDPIEESEDEEDENEIN